jgi:hypothetical protein
MPWNIRGLDANHRVLSTDPAQMKAVAGQRILKSDFRYRFMIELPSLGKAG